jgi:hypothetical protein
MSKFTKIAAPPGILPPPGLGAPMPPLPPLPGLPGMPGMPPPPGVTPSSNQKAIKEPLSNLGLILADAEIEKMLMEELQFNEREIANKIWKMYGGDDEGGVKDGHSGKRKEGNEITDEEINATDKSRWERLPFGQSLIDLEIELDDMANAVKFLSFGFAKNKSKEQAGGAPGGMPMASLKLENMVKLARNLDFYGLYSVADRIL